MPGGLDTGAGAVPFGRGGSETGLGRRADERGASGPLAALIFAGFSLSSAVPRSSPMGPQALPNSA